MGPKSFFTKCETLEKVDFRRSSSFNIYNPSRNDHDVLGFDVALLMGWNEERYKRFYGQMFSMPVSES